MKKLLGFCALLAACGGTSTPTTTSPTETETTPVAAAPEGPAPIEEPSANGEAPPTWDGFAAGFTGKYCISCHSGTEKLKDYSVRENVVAVAAAIRCGITPKEEPLAGCDPDVIPAGIFPVGDGPKPTDDERRMMLRWVEAGTP